MKQGLTPWDWEYIGAVFANTGSDDQIKFFKAFIKECGSWGTRLQVEQQLSYINIGLAKEEREALSMLSFNE